MFWLIEVSEPLLLPLDEPFEEEEGSNYKPEYFYPVKIGEIFQDKFQVMFKLGYGGSSTAWIVRNQQP